MLDDPSGASDWLNIFRRNRIEGWQDVSYDQNTVIEEVRKERRRELCIEGHRWFDLRRYAVCRKAPLRKAIERVFAVYDWDSKMKFMRGEVFRLEIDIRLMYFLFLNQYWNLIPICLIMSDRCED